MFGIFRAISLNLKIHNPDYVIATVTPERVSFYNKLFEFQQVSSPKIVRGLDVPESVLIAVDGKRLEKILDQKKITEVLPSQLDEYMKSGILLNNE